MTKKQPKAKKKSAKLVPGAYTAKVVKAAYRTNKAGTFEHMELEVEIDGGKDVNEQLQVLKKQVKVALQGDAPEPERREPYTRGVRECLTDCAFAYVVSSNGRPRSVFLSRAAAQNKCACLREVAPFERHEIVTVRVCA